MTNEAKYFRIGVFIIGGLVMLAAALVTFGLGQFFKQKIVLETYVDGTVQGIEVGSAVKFRGVTIGKVATVGFTFTLYPEVDRTERLNYVVLVMQIDREIFPGMFDEENFAEILERNVAKGLRAQIEPQGITGMNYVEINYLEASRFEPLRITWKPEHYYLPSAPGELTNFLDSVNNIMREVENLNITGISEGTVTLLENLNKAVTGAKLDELSTGAQELFEAFEVAVRDAEIPRLSEETRTLVENLTKAVEDLNVEQLSAQTRVLLAEVQKSNAELRTILENLEPASQINGDDVAATMSNLRIISENLREASGNLSRDPSRLIFSRPPPPASVMDPPNRKGR